MIIEQPPWIYRLFFPKAVWRIHSSEKNVYLTFDDGPHPEITPWVLDLLDHYQIKATFFCVGDNVRKYPDTYQMILDRGHKTGNHTFHHCQGIRSFTKRYVKDTYLAGQYIESKLFRPPHGHMRFNQYWCLSKNFRVIMWDVVTRDYSKRMTPEKVYQAVKKYTRYGSILVFHDSLKAKERIIKALPQCLEWLIEQGYIFRLIDENVNN